jgi:hypothetical protein
MNKQLSSIGNESTRAIEKYYKLVGIFLRGSGV